MPEGVFDCPKDSFGEKSFTFVEKRFLPSVSRRDSLGGNDTGDSSATAPSDVAIHI